MRLFPLTTQLMRAYLLLCNKMKFNETNDVCLHVCVVHKNDLKRTNQTPFLCGNRNGLISTVKIGQCFIPTRHIWISKCTKKERQKNKDKNRAHIVLCFCIVMLPISLNCSFSLFLRYSLTFIMKSM
jgi:hypothetical protein